MKKISALFWKLTKSEYLSYTKNDRDFLTSAIDHFSPSGDNFDANFSKNTMYFDDEVADQHKLMTVLLEHLIKYQAEAIGLASSNHNHTTHSTSKK